ncbi:MAG: hypothetical protein FWG45_07165 [Oscillospiraceae bacterium]|nr:hypothetical protein [Oscillospiraceae bacterium]
MENFTETPETEFDKADIDANKTYAILAYLGILFLVPLLAAPESPFAKFHANQGAVLFIASIILGVGGAIASAILNFIPIIGGLFGWLVTTVVFVGAVLFIILGTINAANGQAKELPVIGKFKLIK